ncbi:hypothetical protein V7O66_06580 [Methanolobus sp. ZRKC3]|uniref:hypothetical protein n=1 Tax=Methanolobus sp. ZRKC3 TaxID=3125786 RepID=UPI00324351F2
MVKEDRISSDSAKNIDRMKLLDVSSWLVESLRIRLAADRFREREGDSIKLQYLRVLVQAMQAHNSILKEQELEEIKTRLDQLEGNA